MNDAEIRLQVKIDDTQTSKSISNIQTKMTSLSNTFKNTGKNITASLTLPIVALGTIAVKNASDLAETMNKVDVAFGDSADSVKKWSKNAIKSFGMAQGTALDMVALFGDMATGMGINQEEASRLATSMTGLAGDLASFKNISQDVAKTALAGVFTGETESLKQLGIVMTEVNLEEFARTKGIKKSIQAMTQQEKIQLRYNFITEASKNAVGDFARTSDSTANRIRMASQQFKELSATLGTQLLPIINKVLGKLSEFMSWVSSLNSEQQKWLLILLGVVAALGPLAMLLGSIIGLFIALASPIGLIVVAVALVTAGIVYLGFQLWKVRDSIGSFVNYMYQAFLWVGDKITGILKGIANGFIGMVNTLVSAINFMLSSFISPFNATIGALNKLPGVNMPKLSLAIPKIPKLATGTNNIQRDGLAYLHQGEAVVPKKYNPAMGGNNANIVMQVPDIYLDGQKLSRSMTPYITKTVKLSGGKI